MMTGMMSCTTRVVFGPGRDYTRNRPQGTNPNGPVFQAGANRRADEPLASNTRSPNRGVHCLEGRCRHGGDIGVLTVSTRSLHSVRERLPRAASRGCHDRGDLLVRRANAGALRERVMPASRASVATHPGRSAAVGGARGGGTRSTAPRWVGRAPAHWQGGPTGWGRSVPMATPHVVEEGHLCPGWPGSTVCRGPTGIAWVSGCPARGLGHIQTGRGGRRSPAGGCGLPRDGPTRGRGTIPPAGSAGVRWVPIPGGTVCRVGPGRAAVGAGRAGDGAGVVARASGSGPRPIDTHLDSW